ncbi:MAG: PD-(D/E)XK nuclease family protein [Firmicutes bacterium]|nr:PD-(D/E)XK nuclease family protein [Bacillota bacterium]
MAWHLFPALRPGDRRRAVGWLLARMASEPPAGQWLWLAATAALRREAEREWAERPPLFLRGRLATLHELAGRVLAVEGRALRPLDEAARAWLVGRLVRELEAAGEAGPLAGHGDRPHLAVALGGLFLELEQAGAEPPELERLLREARAEAGREPPLPAELLAGLYRRYREELERADLRDGAAEYLVAARLAAARRRTAGGAGGRHVPLRLVLDGFHDLTPAQARLLAAVSGAEVEESFLLWAGDPADEADRRALASFAPLFDPDGLAPEEAPAWPSGEEDGPGPDGATPPRLLRPADRSEEVGQALALTAEEPEETLLVARTPGLYLEALARACRAHGLPAPAREERLDRTPSGRALLDLARLRWRPGARAAASLLRSRLWAPAGDPSLLLAALAAAGEAPDGDWSARLQVRAATAGADPELRLLPWEALVGGWSALRRRLEEAVPAGGRPSRLLASLLQLAEAMGAPDVLAAREPGERSLRAQEWESLREFQRSLERVEGDEAMEGGRFLEQLGQALSLAAVRRPAESPRAPRLVHPSELRGLPVRRLVLLGLHEGGWPQAYHPDGLLGEELRERLRRRGLRLESRESLRLRERFLFRAACAAGAELWFSLPRFEGASPLEPSTLLPPVAETEATAPPPFATPLRAALACGRGPDPASLERRRRAERSRRSPRLDAWQGWLEGDRRLVAYLTARHEGGAHLDVTAVNAYLTCPFQFLVVHEWRLRTPPVPAQALTPLDEGNLLHRLLASLLRPLLGRPLAELEGEPVRRRAEAELEALLDDWSARALPPPAAVEGARRSLRRLLEAWLRAEAGRARAGYDLRPLAVEAELELSFTGADGRAWRLPGRADRVDGGDGEVVIYDYKRSDRDARAVLELRDVQLPAYALAWEQRQPSRRVLGAAWYNLRDLDVRRGLWRLEARRLVDLGRTEPGYLPDALWRELLERLPERLALVGVAIQAGRFPVLPAADCPPGCPAAEVCRVEPARLGAKRSWWETSREAAAGGSRVDG